MSKVQIGKLIDDKASKDAVHVAVFPAFSTHILKPGQRVHLLVSRTNYRGLYEVVPEEIGISEAVGVVDPFLKEDINPGQAFFVMVFPDDIGELHHEWKHSKFKDEPERQVYDYEDDGCNYRGC